MKNLKNRRRALMLACPLILLVAALTAAAFQKKAPATPDDPLIAGFKKSYPASVSDAVELVTGKNGSMVVPQERAEEVLKRAQEIDDRERGMFPFIRQHKSLQKAIEAFNRI